MSILVKDVLLGGKRTNILVDGNRIARLDGRPRAEHVIDGRGKAAIPGFVNTHTHAAMTLLRGYADDMALDEWLQRHIWPVEAKMTEKDVYWGTRLACLEMAKSGTTCFNDMYWHVKGAVKAVEDSGLRAQLSSVYIDMFSQGKAALQRAEAERHAKRCNAGSRVTISLGPHAIYTVTEESLRWVKELSDKRGLNVHFHLSETRKEVDDCLRAHGKTPVEYLADIGFLGPRLLCAHAVWLSRREIRLLAQHGAKVSHCPTSNMKLSVGGAMDYVQMRKSGVTVSLGTDGASSNNSLDMFGAMKSAALLHKMAVGDPTVLPAADALRMATLDGACALGIEAGIIQPGALADLTLVNLKRPEMTPLHNLESNLVYSAGGGCVDTVICDGSIVMESGIVEGEEEVIEKAGKAAMRLADKNET